MTEVERASGCPISVVDLFWRFGPEPTVEDQQPDRDQAPDGFLPCHRQLRPGNRSACGGCMWP